MDKKELRVITASEDIAKVIDRGAIVDTAIKNLTAKDKTAKAKIVGQVNDEFKEDESSVRLEGHKFSAVVTAAKKYEMLAMSQGYDVARVAVTTGLLSDVVAWERTLAVPPEQIDKAVNLLKKAGIAALVQEEFRVNPEAYRAMSVAGAPKNVAEARAALKACVLENITFKVKYEKAGK